MSSAATASAASIQVADVDTDVVADHDGVCTLREAINAANDNFSSTSADCTPGDVDAVATDVIRLPAGLDYGLVGSGGDDANSSGDLDVRGRVTIVGPGSADAVVSGGGHDRVFDVQPGAAVRIAGLTIKDGKLLAGPSSASEGGGGGRAEDGGGVRNAGSLSLVDAVVTDNATG